MKKVLLISVSFLIFGCSSNESSPKNIIDANVQIFNPSLAYGMVTDIDGKNYKTIQIGSQVWMAENLKVTRYRNGDPIPEIKSDTEWANLTTGAWCHNDNNAKNELLFGKLYNWYAVNDSRKLAPLGWHIPTDSEWTILATYLGGESVAGGKIKETGTTHWKTPNTNATNESGFTGVPGAYRINQGFSIINGEGGDWWSSLSGSPSQAFLRYIKYNNSELTRSLGYKSEGYSVRCIKD